MTSQPRPDHPALQGVALLINGFRDGSVKGTPRAIANRIIDMVFDGEATLWSDSDTAYVDSGKDENGDPLRQKVLTFYGHPEVGSAKEGNAHPLGLDKPLDALPPVQVTRGGLLYQGPSITVNTPNQANDLLQSLLAAREQPIYPDSADGSNC